MPVLLPSELKKMRRKRFANTVARKSDSDVLKQRTHQRSTKSLEEAIKKFPFVVTLLADKIDMFLPTEIRSNTDFRVHIDARCDCRVRAKILILTHDI